MSQIVQEESTEVNQQPTSNKKKKAADRPSRADAQVETSTCHIWESFLTNSRVCAEIGRILLYLNVARI